MSRQPECPICLESDADMCLPCYHWVHRTCWKRVVNKTICPTCRQSVIPSLPTFSTEETRLVERKVDPPSESGNQSRTLGYSNIIDTIYRITDWYTQNGRKVDLGLDLILSMILQGRELASKDIDYVNKIYHHMLYVTQLDRPLESIFLSLSLGPAYIPLGGGKPKLQRVCMRCNRSLPFEAYGPRKRICKACRP